MPIEDFVDVTVTKEGGAVTRQGFGTPVFLNANVIDPNRVNYYASLTEITDAGHLITSELYKWATIVFSQNPAPNRVASGRQDAGDAGDFVVTLVAMEVEDSTGWYFVNAEVRDDVNLTALAAAIEARKKVGVWQTSSAALLAGTGGNIGEVLRLAAYKRSFLLYHDDDTEYLDAGMTAIAAAADLDAPRGQITWALKQISGVPTDALTLAQETFVKAENANLHVEVGGRGVTTNGTSSEGEFMDVQTTLDWLFFRTQERVFAALATTSTKVPFTNEGIALVVGEVQAVMNLGVANGHLSGDVLPVVTAPDIADIQPADKTARLLQTVQGTGVLAGAIHKAKVNIKVTA